MNWFSITINSDIEYHVEIVQMHFDLLKTSELPKAPENHSLELCVQI